MADEPWMDVNPMLWDQARESWDNGRDDEILLCMDNMEGLDWVWQHRNILRDRGTYEKALLEAYSRCRVNWCHISLLDLKYLFTLADKNKMLLVGDHQPDQRRNMRTCETSAAMS